MSRVRFPQPIHGGTYQRRFEAEIDCLGPHELRVRGEMRDQRFALRHKWRLRTPDYEILESEATQIAGDFDSELCRNYQDARGVRIGRGFSKLILQALGEGRGTREHLLLAIEMARVGQQVYQFPPELEVQFGDSKSDPGAAVEARTAWLKDRSYMADLANSCYTYRDESAELFESRAVRCTFAGDITRPRPGEEKVFWRRKNVLIRVLSNEGYFCESSMEDSIHDIKVEFEIGGDAIIRHASSRGLRLPYQGICEDAQLRTPGLVGLEVTNDFVRQFADQVGGRSGCTHLFDLSIDCLRLFEFV